MRSRTPRTRGETRRTEPGHLQHGEPAAYLTDLAAKARSAFVGDCLASCATAADIPCPPSQVRATGLCLDEVSPGDDGRVRSASGSSPCRGARQVEGRGRGVERTGPWASAPEFGELLGKRSALVVTSSSGGRTQR
jgi:hypothetical protein